MNLTVSQLTKACIKHKYLILRESDVTYAINSKIVSIAKKPDAGTVTNIISFMPCDFHTYISNKVPYLRPTPPKP